MMSTEADYRRAQEDASYRQAFLDSMDLEDAWPYVRRVFYRPSRDGDTVMEVKPSFLQRHFVRRIRSDIRVYPLAFSGQTYPLYDDFLGDLIDHEGYHARELYEEPRVAVFYYWKLLLNDVEPEKVIRFRRECELRATMNQLAARLSGKRNLSDTNISHVFIEIERLSKSLGVGVEFSTGDGRARIVEI